MMFLKQSTTITVKIGPFLDDSDGKTAETGLTISQADVRLSKNGGDYGQKNDSNACTHDELGEYNCQIDGTDTGTLGRLKLIVHESGALPVWHEYMVIPSNVYDSLFSTDKLQVDAVEISSDSAAADSLELFAENAKGTDHKVLISTDAQDLSGSLDVNTKKIEASDATDTIQSSCDDALVANHLDHLLKTDYDPSSKPGTATALLNELVENDSGVSRFTQNALEQGPDTTSGLTLHSDYDAAKTAAQAGDQMDLVDAPNGTAVAAIQSGLSTHDAAAVKTAVEADGSKLDSIYDKLPSGTISDFDESSDEVDVGEVKGAAVTGVNDFKADVSNLDAAVSSRSSHAAADVKTAIEAAGSHLALIKAETDKLGDTLEDDGGTYRFTENALEEGPSGSGLSAQETRDAMKLAPSAGAPAAGSVDKHLDDASTHDAAAVVTALMAKTGITAGGTASYEDILKAIYAMARGKIVKTGDSYAFRDDDDTTTLFTLTIAAGERSTA